LLIQQTLNFPYSEKNTSVYEETLVARFQNFSGGDYDKLSFHLIPHGNIFSLDPTFFPLYSFAEYVKPILQVIAKVLGKENTSIIDRVVTGIFNFFMQPEVILDIPTFWEGLVNSKLSNLNLTGCFIFPPLLVYFFLYVHAEKFMHLGLTLMDCHKRKQSMIN